MQEVLNLMTQIGKQMDLGLPVGRVWGFLLFRSCPVTQREIEEGTGYSRGLISRCLKILGTAHNIEVRREGHENRYSVRTSLTDDFVAHFEHFIANMVNPMIEILARNADEIEDSKVRERFHTLLHEFKKLYLATRIFSGIIKDINLNAIATDMEDAEDYVVTVNIEAREDYEENNYYKGDSKNGNE